MQALVKATRAVKGTAPAVALVIVARGQKPVVLVDGTADVRSGTKADANTPFYIASMTKAYVGVLALELDRKGILKLDSSVADYWPNLRISGVDTKAVTLRHLLTHRFPFENSVLGYRTAYTDEVPAAAYPRLLASYSKVREQGFSYSNLGYLLYSAILEKETKQSWKDWLASDVFRPLGLDHSSARSSDFPVVTAAHQWTQAGWHAFAMKPDALMHAAGGLVTSPNDMARWLEAHLGESALPASTFQAAHTAIPYPTKKEGNQSCDGYALGWSRCTAHAVTYLEHGGGYTGFRSQMAILPDRGIAFAFLTNSDSMTGTLSGKLMDAFVQAVADPVSALIDPAAFAADYAKLVADQAANRAKRDEKDRADTKWKGWTWKPSAKALASYVGRYHNDSLGDMTVRLEGQTLVATLGAFTMPLVPAAQNVFAGIPNPAEKRELVLFEEDRRSLSWNDDIYTRLPG